VSSHTSDLGDDQTKEKIIIISNTINPMTIGILILILQSVVVMSSRVVNPIHKYIVSNLPQI
jgi:hypothetical protein